MCKRWQTACHEAGHVVTAHALGGRVCGAVIFPDGGGVAAFDQMSPDPVAIAIAAGRLAEKLADQFAPPMVADASPALLTPDQIETLPVFQTAPTLACDLGRTADDRKSGANDDRLLAEWAIFGREDDPDSWAGRIAFAKRVAAEIVSRNTDAIVRVATTLFASGSLSESEIISHIESLSQ